MESNDLWSTVGELQQAVRNIAPEPIGSCLPLISVASRNHIEEIWSAFSAEDSELFSDARTVGYAYQYFRLPSRKQAQKNAQSADKQMDTEQLAAFTQLYTPYWVVDFLLQNTLLPQLSPDLRARLANHWLIENAPNEFSRTTSDITVLDPACGAGHFLHDAFSNLVECHKLTGETSQQSARRAITQIHGADIDVIALHAAALTLLIKFKQTCGEFPREPWSCLTVVDADALGSLSRSLAKDHPLNQSYSVIVTNPPYIGRRLITRELKTALKQEYPGSAHDLAAPFVVRALEQLQPGGRLGFITQASLLSLPSFQSLREDLLEHDSLKVVVDLGTGVFPLQAGDKVNSVLLVAEAPVPPKNGGTLVRNGSSAQAVFVDLSQLEDKEDSLRLICRAPDRSAESAVFIRDQSEFQRTPFSAFHYKCPPPIQELLLSPQTLESIADVRQGLATTDNQRFLRYMWEVDPKEIGTTWFPYVKGAGSERWTSPVLNVVNFADNGREIKETVANKYPYLNGKTAWVVKNEQYYFRAGLCFSFVSTEQFCARILPAGCIFDVAASALFPAGDSSDFLLAYLNSTLIRSICKLLNPTINMQVGDVKRVPLLSFNAESKHALAQLARACVDAKARLDSFTQPHFRLTDSFPLATTLNSDDPESSFNRLSSQIVDLNDRLNTYEQNIDQIMLQQCMEALSPSKSDRASILRWLSDCDYPPVAHPAKLMSKAQVAEFAVFQAVTKQILVSKDGPVQSIELGFSQPSVKWAEENLGTSLSSFLTKRLPTVASKVFKGKLPAWFDATVVSRQLDLSTSDGRR